MQTLKKENLVYFILKWVLILIIGLPQTAIANHIQPQPKSSLSDPRSRELVEQTKLMTLKLDDSLQKKADRIPLADNKLVRIARNFIAFSAAQAIVPVSIALLSGTLTYKAGIASVSILQQTSLENTEFFSLSERRKNLRSQYDRYLVSDSFEESRALQLRRELSALEIEIGKSLQDHRYPRDTAVVSFLAAIIAGIGSLPAAHKYLGIHHGLNKERLDLLIQKITNNLGRLLSQGHPLDEDIYEAYFNAYTFLQLVHFESLVVATLTEGYSSLNQDKNSASRCYKKEIVLIPKVDEFNRIDKNNYLDFWPTHFPLVQVKLESSPDNPSVVLGSVEVSLDGSEQMSPQKTFTLLKFQSAEVGFVEKTPFPSNILGTTLDSFTYKKNVKLLNTNTFSKHQNELKNIIQSSIDIFKAEVASAQAQKEFERQQRREKIAQEENAMDKED